MRDNDRNAVIMQFIASAGSHLANIPDATQLIAVQRELVRTNVIGAGFRRWGHNVRTLRKACQNANTPEYRAGVSRIISEGQPVIPLHQIVNGNCDCKSKAQCEKPGKHPYINWKKGWSKNPEQIKQWDTDFRGCNWGFICGDPSGIFALDVDGEIGEVSLSALEREHGKLPITRTVITGRGRHLHFKKPKGLWISNNQDGKLGAKLDVKGDGGYAIIPPSEHHATGKIYGYEPDIEPADAPTWLLNLVTQPAATGRPPKRQALKHQGTEPLDGFPKGQRDTGAFKYAVKLLERGNTVKETVELVTLSLEHSPQPAGDEVGRDLALEKVGNACKFLKDRWLPTGTAFQAAPWVDALLSVAPVICTTEDKAYFVFNGRVYEPVSETAVRLLLKDRPEHQILRKYYWGEIFYHLQGRPECALSRSDLNPFYILNLKNGIFDLREDNPELREHSPDFRTTMMLDFSFDEEATCPFFDKWLDDKIPDRDTKVTLLRMLGYLITSDTSLEVWFVIQGKKRTGKSTLGRIITALVGTSRVSNIALEDLGGGGFKAARIADKLVNLSSETNRKELIDSAFIKRLTGRDRVAIEEKYQKAYDLDCKARLVHLCNHFPRTDDLTDSFWDRPIIIPMNQQHRKNPELGDRLISEEELSGIFRRHVLPSMLAARTREEIPVGKESKEALVRWRIDTDAVQEWADENLQPSPEGHVDLQEAYDHFIEWQKRTGHKSDFTTKHFGERVEGLGFRLSRTHNVKTIRGCFLVSAAAPKKSRGTGDYSD